MRGTDVPFVIRSSWANEEIDFRSNHLKQLESGTIELHHLQSEKKCHCSSLRSHLRRSNLVDGCSHLVAHLGRDSDCSLSIGSALTLRIKAKRGHTIDAPIEVASLLLAPRLEHDLACDFEHHSKNCLSPVTARIRHSIRHTPA